MELLASPRRCENQVAGTAFHAASPNGSPAFTTPDPVVQGVPVTQGDSNPKCFKKQHSFASTGDVFTGSKLRRISSAAKLQHLESQDMHIVRLSTKEKLEGKRFTLKEAKDQIFGHLNFDPDGGIANLLDENVSYNSEQVSKRPFLVGGFSKQLYMFITACRLAININAIMYTSWTVVFCYFSPSCPRYLWQEPGHLSQNSSLPLAEIALVVAVTELLGGCILVLRSLYNLVRFQINSVATAGAPPSEVMRTRYEKYRHLARFVWDDLPVLQSFSALYALANVHPGVIGHYAKEAQAGNSAAVALLERYLGVMPGERLTEEEVHEWAVVQLMRVRHEDLEDEDERENMIHHYLLLSPYQLLCEVKMSHDVNLCGKLENSSAVSVRSCKSVVANSCEELGSLDRQQSEVVKEAGAQALNRLWRVRFIMWAESALFWLWSLCLFVFGAAAFITKFAEAAIVLFDPAASRVDVLFKAMVFLNQVMGIFAVNMLLRWRLFRFIFGGQDARVGTEEQLLRQLYEACLAEAIWSSTTLPLPTKVGVLVAFDDDDLQRLVLEESDVEKAKVVGPIWRALMGPSDIGKQQDFQGLAQQGFLHACAVKWARGG
jgi:hypothetical protein